VESYPQFFRRNHLSPIYAKLNYSPKSVWEYLDKKQPLEEKEDFIMRKTLYLQVDKRIDLELGKCIERITDTIFRYEDMKVVVRK